MKLRTSMLAGVVALLSASAAHADKNYLVVIMDDIDVGKVSSYAGDYAGYTPSYLPDTLTLDTLASRGLRFTHTWATPECSPTRVSFMTGQHPSRTGIGAALGNNAAGMDWTTWISAATGRSTLAAEFATRGYTTGQFGKWHEGRRNANGSTSLPPSPFTVEPNPSLAGFDRFWGSYDGYLGTGPGQGYTNWTQIDWLKGGSGTVTTETTHATKKTEETALAWIKSRTQPWFAVVAFNAAHSGTSASTVWDYPDVATTEHRTSALSCLATSTCTDRTRQVYQGLVEDLDIKLYKLLNGIDPAVLENTLIVVYGDNGAPSPVEESVFNVAGRGKATTYENGVRIPLIIADGYAWVHGTAGPTISSINQRIDAKVNTVDIYNTLLDDAFGTTNSTAMDSSSFKQCFDQASDPNHWCGWTSKRYGYTEMFTSNTSSNGGQATVSYGEDTMVTRWDSTGLCLTHEFYDGSTDPLQTTQLFWTGTRATRLENQFNTIHTGFVDWANPTGTAVQPFCP